jgi:hypothetical protein
MVDLEVYSPDNDQSTRSRSGTSTLGRRRRSDEGSQGESEADDDSGKYAIGRQPLRKRLRTGGPLGIHTVFTVVTTTGDDFGSSSDNDSDSDDGSDRAEEEEYDLEIYGDEDEKKPAVVDSKEIVGNSSAGISAVMDVEKSSESSNGGGAIAVKDDNTLAGNVNMETSSQRQLSEKMVEDETVVEAETITPSLEPHKTTVANEPDIRLSEGEVVEVNTSPEALRKDTEVLLPKQMVCRKKIRR